MTDTRYVATRSATGKRHAMTVEARDTTNVAVCGSSATMPNADALEATGGELVLMATALNDLHLEGLDVCDVCRARLNVAACSA